MKQKRSQKRGGGAANWFLMTGALLILSSCSGEGEVVEEVAGDGESSAPQVIEVQTVKGVLEHFPQDVKSVQAWSGHEFMVGGTPIRPTESIPREMLMDNVGRKVVIEGGWNSGERYAPSGEEAQTSSPVFPDGANVVRGEGIEATSLREIVE